MSSNPKVAVLYGSQTGTAEDIALQIWQELRRHSISATISCMNERLNAVLEYPVIVFVCSTTGHGAEPDNMKTFWRLLLRKNLPSNLLAKLRFGILGLGDSSYALFNVVAKRLNRRLKDLGGQELLPTGLADDQHELGTDAVVGSWIKLLIEKLNSELFLGTDVNLSEGSYIYPPRWDVIQHSEGNIKEVFPDSSLQCISTLVGNNRTAPENYFQEVIFLKFLLPTKIEYNPGDVLLLEPSNAEQQVESFFKLFGKICPEDIICVKQVDPEMPVPDKLVNSVTVKSLVQSYWDLTAVPRRHAFRTLSYFTDDVMEKERLLELSAAEGIDDYITYCQKPKRNIIEMLEDFPSSCKSITWPYLFEIFQPIRPRYFSIASSEKVHEKEIHLLVAVVEYKTIMADPRRGLCSNWLANLPVGTSVPVSFKKGTFVFPSDPQIPLILVATGTGIAPFRNLIFHMNAQGTATQNNLFLLFGCRYSNKDFHFKDELMTLSSEGKLRLFCAFSRDQENKVYVQHVISRERELLWKLLSERKAHVYVAGSAVNMPTAVKEAFLQDVCCTAGGHTLESANSWFNILEKSKRYQVEAWN